MVIKTLKMSKIRHPERINVFLRESREEGQEDLREEGHSII